MPQSRWFITIPPEGGARQAARQAAEALAGILDPANLKVFDTLTYLTAFRNLLKKPDDEIVTDLVNQSLAIQALDFGATHLLVPALAPVTAFTLNLLRRRGMRAVHWFYEDYRRARYWEGVIGQYDVWCAIQRGAMQAACESRGVKHVFLPTAGTPPACPPPAGSDRRYDIAFIGIPTGYRIATLEYLAANGITLLIAGSGWNQYHGPMKKSVLTTGWTEGEALSRHLYSAKIGLNLSVDDPFENPADTHISPRVFDVLLHGMALVSEDVPLLHETLGGLSYETFTGKESALAKVRGVLDGYPGMTAQIEANRQRVMAHHLYRHRMEALIQAAG